MAKTKKIITADDPKPMLSFWQIWNMSFGFLGVQYAFGLQQAFMSPIYRYLGVEESNIPFLWLAAPVTGLIVQPIVGAMSDRTWTRMGRRRPYFLVGAIISSICLILMPQSQTLWMAAGLMWILDSAANITMEPFRAFIADKLPEKQRSLGFAVQTFFLGGGLILATSMAYCLVLFGFDISEETTSLQRIPDYVKYPFYIGSVVLLMAVVWTIVTTPEYPPADVEAFKAKHKGENIIIETFKEIYSAVLDMPKTMAQMWWMKFFTWFSIPMIYSYLGLAIARHVYNAPDETYLGFSEGIKMGGIALTVMNAGCVLVSFVIPLVSSKIGRRLTHAICLTIGGIGFISFLLTTNIYGVMFCMVLVGIAWSSVMTMPYVMLSSIVPKDRMGVYMGLFACFIVIPMIINNLSVPFFYKTLLGNDPRNALVMAGIFFLFAALSNFMIGKKAEASNID